MKAAQFVSTYNKHLNDRPYSNPGEYRNTMNELKVLAAPEHISKVIEYSYMSDKCVCSCGWESQSYFDGADLAFDDWLKHVNEQCLDTEDAEELAL